ncbi:MAG TPA: hypothetical protein VGM17_06145 [Rhizomicrobium sp.]|jgi:putative flippase GtrA
MAESANATTGAASALPVQKVLVGGVAGAVTTVLVFFWNSYSDHKIPAEVAAALTTLITFVISYLVPPNPKEAVKP